MKKTMVLFSIIFLASALILQGCASSRYSRTEVTTQRAQKGQAIEGNRGDYAGGEDAAADVEKTTTVKEQRVSSAPRGIFGTTVHFIGQVLAFPFKLIAGAIEFVF